MKTRTNCSFSLFQTISGIKSFWPKNLLEENIFRQFFFIFPLLLWHDDRDDRVDGVMGVTGTAGMMGVTGETRVTGASK